ncbi:hypothetical protein K501DRAFT_190531 [Backusella circina FSU 941]|nr:hypothetical protein K501DRAFT_190531 [Backusella circina FSU 941]
MCKDLGLNHDIADTKPNLSIEIERRKRTFWAVFCYDVMMSIENGTVPNFENTPLMLEAPTMLADEASTDYENMMHFILFTKVIRVQANTLRFLRQKYKPTDTLVESTTTTIETLSENLYSVINVITSTCTPPQRENFSYSACFLYLASSFACILLHRPSMRQDKNALHECIEAANKIKHIIQLVLECDGIENIYCSIRGIQQMVHYLSAAVTIFKVTEKTKELQDTLFLTRQLASISPATEVIKQEEEIVVMENRLSEQSLKRKSLHLPENRAMRRNRLSMPIMDDALHQQQQHYAHFQYDEPSSFIEQYDTEMTSVHHQQQSHLGLLFNDDESTMKDIPTL